VKQQSVISQYQNGNVLHVQIIVVGLEWLGSCASSNGVHHSYDCLGMDTGTQVNITYEFPLRQNFDRQACKESEPVSSISKATGNCTYLRMYVMI
jgi:hypothetical protein